MIVLVLNCGSSSVKWRLLDARTGRTIQRGTVERVGAPGRTHAQALGDVLPALAGARVEAVGHRVVHGGERFREPALVTDEVVQAIEACVPLAPLHNPANLAGIRAARELFPSVPQVAVFDTAFHHTLPRRASTYAIDSEVAARHGIRRYGFHGTSHAFVCRQAAAFLRTALEQLRIVSLHLGNGASACAVELGRSVETSMGLTPLEGLIMGTRSGDIDPGVLITLLRREGWTVDELDRHLNERSGLAGLSGHGNDLRDIEERAAQGDERARLAVSAFAHRVRKYLGGYAAVMGGVDAVVLTGGIGENSAVMRHRILQRFDFLGLVLDDERNADARVSEERRVAEITSETSRVRALVVATDEELAIAQETARLVGEGAAFQTPRGVPVAVSARHVHLDQETLEKLFGQSARLTPRNPLFQPGQFACEETVSLVGPRRRIDGVRILGPVRKQTQVEVSRTDEFFLGVDAPVRGSGDLRGSAPITLEGPKGSVQLKEGLIRALRHIHMSPDDARAFGVEDGDYVAVAITGGPRDLVFGDVLVRVSRDFALEMHIDTDEGNAADLPAGAEGCYVPLTGRSGTLTARRPTRRLRILAEDLLREHAGPR